MPKVPKIRSLHIFAICPDSDGDEVDFLSADKHESFLQVDTITLGVQSQACSKYPKEEIYNIYVIPQGKRQG